MNELALFAGAGGGILAGHLLGWKTVCAVEQNEYAASVLAARQNDGTFSPFPIWDDVCTFDGRPWRGLVDVVSGGFPCQDISVAGKGAGIDGERSGLWREMARIIGEVQPRFIFVENSPMLIQRGLAVVLSDLATMGYDSEWCCLSAQDIGAPHIRDRIWIKARKMADTTSKRQQGQGESINASNKNADREEKTSNVVNVCLRKKWPTEPKMDRVVDGMANRMEQLTAIGNGQVPRVAASAFSLMVKKYEP